MSVTNSIYKRRYPVILPAGIFAILLGALFFISSLNTPVSEANGVPADCLKDSGEPAEPLPYPGAWAIIMNFNHVPSSTHTNVCWAIRDNDPAMEIVYTTGIRCQLRNNINKVKVGNGEANFDGNFHLTCPKRVGIPNLEYDTFYVHAVADFPEQAGYYPLVRHSDVTVKALVQEPIAGEDWKVTMLSRYGDINFADSEYVPRLSELSHGINSTVYNGTGSHIINRQQLNSQTEVGRFPFDFSELTFIGGGDNPWTLSEMIIDPPAICGNC